jgi:hypothetical protein
LQVEAIFITHLHGDHCFGIGGMLLALDAAKRHLPTPEQRATHIYGPPGLLSYLHTVLVVGGVQQQLSSPVYVTELVETHKGNSRWASFVEWVDAEGGIKGRTWWHIVQDWAHTGLCFVVTSLAATSSTGPQQHVVPHGLQDILEAHTRQQHNPLRLM